DLVAEGIAQAAVDAVAVVGGLLGELDTVGPQLLVGAETVVGLEHHHDAGRALGDQVAHLLGGLLVHHRRAGDVEHDLWNRLAWYTDGEPAEAAPSIVGL